MNSPAPLGAGDRHAGPDRDAKRAGGRDGIAVWGDTLVNNPGNAHTGRMQVDGGAIGSVVRRDDHHPFADLDAIPV